MGNEKMSQNSDYLTPEQEDKLDETVEKRCCSYDDARRFLGLPVDDPKEIAKLVLTTDSRVEAGAEDTKLSLYKEKGWTAKAKRREQEIVNRRGAALAREALERALAKKSGK